MTATVERETVGTLSGFDEVNGTMPVRYVYQGRSPGEEILTHPDIPPLDHVIIVNNVKLYAVGYDVTQYFEADASTTSNGEVVVNYSASGSGGGFKEADYVAWERSFQKESVRVPTFALQARYYNKAGDSSESTRWDWVEQGLAIPVKYATLNVTVNFIAGNLQTRNQILAIMAAIDAQEDHLHVIGAFGTKKWVMQPAQIRQADPLRVEISYHWISDPGNGAPTIPASVVAQDATIKNYVYLPQVERPPFHQYQVRPQRVVIDEPASVYAKDQVPFVYVVDLYPQYRPDGSANPRYDPLGYKSLPGNPFP